MTTRGNARARRFALLALVLGALVGLVLLEIGLRFAERRSLASRPASSEQLEQQLAASERAEPSAAQGRFSLFGLVQASPHADVVYELKPNVVGTFREQPVRTNAYGHRQESTPSLEKPPGTFRVVGLGDSHMFGWGVAQGSTYLELLEQRLRAAGIGGAEVVNCAAPGYNTSMEVALFAAECRAFEPDLVVLHWIGNDFDFPHFMQRADAAGIDAAPSAGTSAGTSVGAAMPGEPELRPEDAPAPGNEQGHSAKRLRWRTLEVLQQVLQGRGEKNGAGDGTASEMQGEMTAAVPRALLPHSRRGESKRVRQAARSQYHDSVGEEGVRAALRRLARLTSEGTSEGNTGESIPVLVLMLGTADEGRQLVAREARDLGFEVLDAAPHFAAALQQRGLEASREVWRDEYLIPDDGHPTARAHLEYAEALLPKVLQIALSSR